MDNKIGFIGSGNMAQAMIGGLVTTGMPSKLILASDPTASQRELITHRYEVQALADNAELAASVDVLVLAVKPQVMAQVARELRSAVQERRPLVVSIAAGIEISSLQNWLGDELAIVRAMPNSPCLIRHGITALHANLHTNNSQRAQAQKILEAVGAVIWVQQENLMDAVTAVSGSGPAYFFLFMEAIEHSARILGLPMEVAWALALHTGAGATRMALESGQDLAQLRRNVTSPDGTTAAALEIFEKAGLREIVDSALTGARDRGREIAREFGQE